MRRFGFALCVYLAVQPLAAHACSFSWRRGHSPTEIRANPNLRQITGTFYFVGNDGRIGEAGTNARGWRFGRILTDRGGGVRTIQAPLQEIAIECGAYLAPTANGVTGTFWISREPRGGRYLLMLFEHRYRPENSGSVPRR